MERASGSGKFVEMMEKWRKLTAEANFSEKLAMFKRHGVTMRDIEEGRFIYQEEGVYGKTTLRLYKLVDAAEVEIEGKIRSTVTPLINNQEEK